MTTYGAISIVDLIIGDLQSNVTLPPAKQNRVYAEPTVITPDMCPFLAVWTKETDYELLTGAQGLEAYSRIYNLTVGWYVATPAAADTGGTGDPATIQSLEVVVDKLDAVLTSYASGIPSASHQVVATIHSARVEPVSGSIWRAAFALRVEQAS